MSTQEIHAAVETILSTAGVTYATDYRGLAKPFGGENDMDEWLCVFTLQGAAKRSERVPFYTGLGLRAAPTAIAKSQARMSFPGLSQKDIDSRTIYGRRYLAEVEKARKPAAPHAASVLHSLISDSVAAGQSFADWCGDFGYDTDSRKAHATYIACQESEAQLLRVFTREQVAALRDAVQDY